MRSAITCVGLSKRYRSSAGSDGWLDALQDVAFEVQAGEAVGLIGRNGAGKSTLLRILSRVTRPTGGYADVRGRVGALLEVGTAFHPELTGRENTFLSGAMLGMTRQEVRRRFDEIVAFSEIEPFIDTPVKRYSSGMYARLGFAVAAHLLPDILIVDEVLAVGDLAFQAKCLARMHRLTEDGTTVLFVSHNLLAVADLCGRGILLERGRLTFDGAAPDAIATYRRSLASSGFVEDHQMGVETLKLGVNGVAAPDGVELEPMGPLRLEVVVPPREAATDTPVFLNIVVESGDGRIMIHLRSDLAGQTLVVPAMGAVLTAEIEEVPLAPGSYSMYARVTSLSAPDAFILDSARLGLTVPGDARTDAVIVPRYRFGQRPVGKTSEVATR